jgi:hypothetical protein
MDWLCFNAAFWGAVMLWLLPRGTSAAFAIVRKMSE